jgi:hypothetical protein
MNWCEDTKPAVAPTAQHPAATVGSMIASQVSSRVRGGGVPGGHASGLELVNVQTWTDVTMLAHPSCNGEAGLTLPVTVVAGACPVPPAVAFTLTARATGRSSRGATVQARAGDSHSVSPDATMPRPLLIGVSQWRGITLEAHVVRVKPFGIIHLRSPCVQAPSLQ